MNLPIVKPINKGRLGNFLFQAACAMGYAWRHGLEFTLPDTTAKPQFNPIYLQHLVNPKFDPDLPVITIEEKGHPYQEIPYSDKWKGHNIVLDGYWQTEKYFEEFRDKILWAFASEGCIAIETTTQQNVVWKSAIPVATGVKGTVAVHVRRGDYIRLAHKHPPVPKEWIEKAMKQFTGVKYLFFSDDIQWCIAEFGHRDDCDFSDNSYSQKPEIKDLFHMATCEHQICSASTFSWWGAWLNQNPDKRVIMPKQWFSPAEMKRTDPRDIVPAEWERL